MSEPAATNEIPSIAVARIGLTTHFTPNGSLNTDAMIAELSAQLQRMGSASNGNCIVDLSMVQIVNSAAIELLLDFQDTLIRRGHSAKVARVGQAVQEIFRITRFHDHVASVDRQASTQFDTSAGTGKVRLGDRLVERQYITADQLKEALAIQNKTGGRLGRIVVEKEWVTDQDVLGLLSEQLDVPYFRLRSRLYDPLAVALLDAETSRRLKVLPLFKVRETLFVATANPQGLPMLEEIQEKVGLKVQPVLAAQEEITKAISEQNLGSDFTSDIISLVDDDFEVVESSQTDDYTTIDEMAAGSPVINLVNSVIQRAVRSGASDIHIEAFRKHSRIRFRIDGVLFEFESPRIELHAPMVSRLKVMANLDIAERRLPQDGRIQVMTQGRSVDLRFSSLPGLHGEKVVLRVLDKNNAILDLNRLGMSDHNRGVFESLLSLSNGLILVTGPTGSGKTTSLYSALNHLNSIEKNIVTIEDPVEYQMEIINQNEVRANIGLSFAKVLKHVLRQDPDIIMVGEIRERETAEIAVQAALTGHLVLSTLHTNDSIGAVTRMIDMGVEPYLLSSALVGVVAQRLVRTVCNSCRTTHVAPPELVERFNWPADNNIKLASGRGCSECYDSGYRGRLAIHETLETSPELQKLIISNAGRDQLVEFLERKDHKSLFKDGIDRVLAGKTTLEEVSRAVAI